MARSPILSCGAGVSRRRHFRARRNDSRDRRGSRDCRTSTAERRDIPSVRLWSADVNFISKRAIAVAKAGPANFQARPNRLTAERKLLVSNPHFVFEQIDLAPNSSWCLDAERETWLLVVGGSAIAGSFDLPQAMPFSRNRIASTFVPGAIGMVGLAAYTGGGPVPQLLQRLTQPGSIDVRQPQQMQMPTSLTQAMAAPKNGCMETIK